MGKLPKMVRFRVSEETGEAMTRRVEARRAARGGSYSHSDYLRELIAADLGLDAPESAPESPIPADSGPSEPAKRRSGTIRRPQPSKEAIEAAIAALEAPDGVLPGLPPPPEPESAPEAPWETSQEPHHVSADGRELYEAIHERSGSRCVAGCDLDADELCLWPRDHPDRSENRRKRRR